MIRIRLKIYRIVAIYINCNWFDKIMIDIDLNLFKRVIFRLYILLYMKNKMILLKYLKIQLDSWFKGNFVWIIKLIMYRTLNLVARMLNYNRLLAYYTWDFYVIILIIQQNYYMCKKCNHYLECTLSFLAIEIQISFEHYGRFRIRTN